jgi:hypothetical protein
MKKIPTSVQENSPVKLFGAHTWRKCLLTNSGTFELTNEENTYSKYSGRAHQLERKFKDILELTNAARNGPLSSPLSADVSENYQLFPHWGFHLIMRNPPPAAAVMPTHSSPCPLPFSLVVRAVRLTTLSSPLQSMFCPTKPLVNTGQILFYAWDIIVGNASWELCVLNGHSHKSSGQLG